MRILGISRSPRFSPNSEDRDQAIFQAVGLFLKEKGCQVDYCSEDEGESLERKLEHSELVYTMARGSDILASLAEKERQGVRIINSPQSLMSYTRGSLFRMFYKEGLPVPRTFCVHPNEQASLPEQLEFPLWIKRSDECAQVKNDVRLVNNLQELHETCHEYFRRDIREALLCEHIEGELLKFYGVSGTDFFYVYSTDTRHGFSKFGLEHQNKVTSHHTFDKHALKKCADRAATLWDISVYGGDAVVNDNGVYIIDFNDWPSFSACRNEAAEAIVQCLLKKEND